MPESHKTGLLKKAVNANMPLLLAWTAVETVISTNKPGTTTTYVEYMDHLVSHPEKLDESNIDNSDRKVNVVEPNFMDSYIPDDNHYEEAKTFSGLYGRERETHWYDPYYPRILSVAS